MSYKIDKGIPRSDVVNVPKYPFADMEIGDSFFVPRNESMSATVMANVGKLKPKKFSYRRRTEDGIDGNRFWRVV
jgi:hypothetical protein